MNIGSSGKNNFIPSEYRKISERLFPAAGFPSGKGPDMKTIAGFAGALGIGAEYKRIIDLKNDSAEMQAFLGHFQNNLDLLIQKTWVEKADERRKEKLQDEVLPLVKTIKEGDYNKAIKMFGTMLNELASLFFGHQSEKEDFTEYTFRIDAQMGLFWWYGGRLSNPDNLEFANNLKSKKDDQSEKVLWAILLLGICYLTNF